MLNWRERLAHPTLKESAVDSIPSSRKQDSPILARSLRSAQRDTGWSGGLLEVEPLVQVIVISARA